MQARSEESKVVRVIVTTKRKAERLELTQEQEDEILYEMAMEGLASGPSEPWDDLEEETD